ncbi:uncharacterized protein VTP21DRAFT_40 [Calcarisporiella thermophila]|uniref:uncharacterized protein n=1 Tax=Calcarisporiella thermophila TaxID=911321 RepID=UPI00374401FF
MGGNKIAHKSIGKNKGKFGKQKKGGRAEPEKLKKFQSEPENNDHTLEGENEEDEDEMNSLESLEDISEDSEADSVEEGGNNESNSEEELGYSDDDDDDDEEEEEEEEDENEEIKEATRKTNKSSLRNTKEERKPKTESGRVKQKLPTPAEGTTLFVRNLLFEATQEDVEELFSQWGELHYCRITKDHNTGLSRGTAFVCFKNKEDAVRCLEEAERVAQEVGPGESETLASTKRQKNKALPKVKSVLMADPSSSLASKFTLHSRVLDVKLAVSREEAGKLTESNKIKREREDKRNLYLMREGVIFPNTPAAETITPSELSKRQASYATRKTLLAKNPSLFISKTRLSVRNLPLSVDDKELRRLAVSAIDKFKQQVREEKREPLSAEERAEGWDKKPKVRQAKVCRSKDRIDGQTKQLRSKGYGFVEYETHAHALAALRYLNNNPDIFSGKKRLIVEFSLENVQVVKRREERMAGISHSEEKSGGQKRKASNEAEGNAGNGKGTGAHKRRRVFEKNGKSGVDKHESNPRNAGNNTNSRPKGKPAFRILKKKKKAGKAKHPKA